MSGAMQLGGGATTPDSATAAADTAPPRLGRDVLRQLLHNWVAVASAAVVVFFVLIALFAPLICHLVGVSATTPHTELVGFDGYPLVGSSAAHPFGVAPQTGWDLFARWVYGARYSLLIATVAATAATFLGVVVGLVAGYLGGWADRLASFVIDLFLTAPFLLVAAAVAAVVAASFGTSGPTAYGRAQLITMMVLLAAFGWMGMARLVRGEVLALRERDFIRAARALGASTPRILLRELLPNLVVPIVLGLSIGIPAIVSAEAGLALLGVGVTDLPSWGATIREAEPWWRADPAYLWQPLLAVLALVLALNLLGDAVRDALDPRSRSHR